MRWQLGILGLLVVPLAGCSSSATSSPVAKAPAAIEATHGSVANPPLVAATAHHVGFPFVDHARIYEGADRSQRFCAVPPARGTIRYDAGSHEARLVVDLSRVKSHGLVGLAWAIPDHGGEVIASIHLDDAGHSEQRTLRFFHTPTNRTRATAIDLTDGADHVIAVAKAC